MKERAHVISGEGVTRELKPEVFNETNCHRVKAREAESSRPVFR